MSYSTAENAFSKASFSAQCSSSCTPSLEEQSNSLGLQHLSTLKPHSNGSTFTLALSEPSSAHAHSGESSDDEANTSPPKLSELECLGCACVLTECVDQLRILSCANSSPRSVDPAHASLQDRLSSEVQKSATSSHQRPLGSETLEKLSADRLFLEQILSRTITELTTLSSFSSLTSAVVHEQQICAREAALLREERENSAQVARLRTQLREERREAAEAAHRADEVIARQKDGLEQFAAESSTELRYVSRWEHARQQQHRVGLAQQETSLHDDNAATALALDVETRVNAEIEAFIVRDKEYLQRQIEEWMDRYEIEMESREMKLKYLRRERAEHYGRYLQLKQLFEQHGSEMREYLAQKEEKERQLAQELHVFNMATRIQAWWKGTMVRRGLGPYRKKKKDKKGGAKDKKAAKGRK